MGCWCQYWRMPRASWRVAKAKDNRAALAEQAASKTAPGLIAYDAEAAPIGWVALGPREVFPGLHNSRFFGATPDTKGLWSVVCFYVPTVHRRQGVAETLLAGAITYATERGARVLEAYPWDLGVKNAATSSLYVGTLALFERAGFQEVARKVPHRPIMQRALTS